MLVDDGRETWCELMFLVQFRVFVASLLASLWGQLWWWRIIWKYRWAHWLSVDTDTLWHPEEKLTNAPLLYFWFGVLTQKRCTVDLSFWDTKQLTVRCRTGSFLFYLFLQNSGAASSHVFTWSVQQLNTFFGILGQIGYIYCALLAPEKLFLCMSVVL